MDKGGPSDPRKGRRTEGGGGGQKKGRKWNDDSGNAIHPMIRWGMEGPTLVKNKNDGSISRPKEIDHGSSHLISWTLVSSANKQHNIA